MGSTGTHRAKGMTDRAFFENEFPTMLSRNGKIIATASKPTSGEWNRVFYAAVKNNDSAPYKPGKTWALIVLMHNARQSYGMNFYYKELDEEMGPAEDTCPDKILDLLSPTENEWANEWRARCRAYNAKRAGAKIANGQLVRFMDPISFSNGSTATLFRYTQEGRRKWWTALEEGTGYPRFRCRLGNEWFNRDHQLVAGPAIPT